MGRIDFCAAVATSIIASTIPEPLNAQVAWRQFDVAGVRIGMGCFQAIDELKSQGYIPNPGGEGRIGTEDQLVALALRKPVPSSILHVQETTEFRRSAISDDNMRQKLVGKYGPPSRDDYYWNKAEEIVWTDEPVPADIMMFAVFAGGGLEYKVDLGEGVRTLTLRETPGVVQQQDREMDAIIRTDVDKSREPPKF